MTPEEREMLEQTLELTRDNNKILHKIRRNNIISSIIRALYWIIILGTAFGAYYFIQPYLSMIGEGYIEIRENIESVKNTTTKLPTWLGGKTE